jgi:hypothetical protein
MEMAAIALYHARQEERAKRKRQSTRESLA